MSNKSIGLGLTLLGMAKILQDYKLEYVKKTNMVNFSGFFHEVCFLTSKN